MAILANAATAINVPTKVMAKQGGVYLTALFGDTESESNPPSYPISQVTPPLASVQASGKGDGLDFAWIELPEAIFQNASSICTAFSLRLRA